MSWEFIGAYVIMYSTLLFLRHFVGFETMVISSIAWIIALIIKGDR